MCKSCNTDLAKYCCDAQHGTSSSDPDVMKCNESRRVNSEIRSRINLLQRRKRLQAMATTWATESQEMRLLVNEAKKRAIRKAHIVLHASAIKAQSEDTHSTKQEKYSADSSCLIAFGGMNVRKPKSCDISMSFDWFGCPATNVAVCLALDEWQNPVALTHVGAGVFRTTRSVPANQPLVFKFIVDGVWMTSPLYPTCCDKSGNINNILYPLRIIFPKTKCNGGVIMVASTLRGWGEIFPMEFSSSEDVYSYCDVSMSPASIQFKFILDGEWVADDGYPVVTSPEGFENNIISFV